jgi:tetratricopeptide (TPR) repeat protein
MSLLLGLVAQVGPFVTPGPQPASPLPPELQERQAPKREKDKAEEPASDLDRCLADARSAPHRAARNAEKWLGKAEGIAKVHAGHCLGLALAGLELWEDAATTLLAARDRLAEEDRSYRARLGAMAGNAVFAQGEFEAALSAFGTAQDDALAGGNVQLAGSIAMDRAYALVALGRQGEAADLLAQAREALPVDPRAWLLSATLSRRMGKLDEAQAQIERAAELLPIDPEIGLEAGRIAMLSGREESARKSWQSVIDAAPESQAAETARAYLAQLDKP